MTNHDNMFFRNVPIIAGLAGGVAIAAFLLYLQLIGQEYAPYIKLIKYVILAIPIIWVLYRYKTQINKMFFRKGIVLGIKTSAIIGITVALINIILFAVSKDISFSKFNVLPVDQAKAILISAILFAEIFVFGNIIAFATLQYLKDDIR